MCFLDSYLFFWQPILSFCPPSSLQAKSRDLKGVEVGSLGVGRVAQGRLAFYVGGGIFFTLIYQRVTLPMCSLGFFCSVPPIAYKR